MPRLVTRERGSLIDMTVSLRQSPFPSTRTTVIELDGTLTIPVSGGATVYVVLHEATYDRVQVVTVPEGYGRSVTLSPA